jgi:hypothetical protein
MVREGVVVGMVWRQVKGCGMLDQCREEERGAALVGRLACWAGSGKMGQMANGPMKKKKKKIFKFQNWLLGLGN